jgi:hypothetical protein
MPRLYALLCAAAAGAAAASRAHGVASAAVPSTSPSAAVPSAAVPSAAVPSSSSFTIWHITDVHIDPYYVTGAIANAGCYCELHDTCPRMPESCVMAPLNDSTLTPAGPFGMPEDNCATPPALWEAAMAFMSDVDGQSASPSPFAFFTGDFGEAGASAACSPTSTAEDQVLGNLNRGMSGVRAALPGARVFGLLGNHDSTPGDVFGSTQEMSWLYEPLADNATLFGASFASDAAALATLRTGGWYATRVMDAPGSLWIVALNTNYWTVLNDDTSNKTGPAYLLGLAQFDWLNATLNAIHAEGGRGILIGHIPPATEWLAGFFTRFRLIVTAYPSVLSAAFFGHNHVDEWTMVRTCTAGGGGGGAPINWIVTPNVDWCSGGNLDVGDAFGAGLWQGDAWCPLLPSDGGSESGRVVGCESLCGNATACAGFTYYPSSFTGGAGTFGSCCFRTSVENMPLNSSSAAVCYAKPPETDCGGGPEDPLFVLFASPSLTEGYPATFPALRRIEVDASTYDVLDVTTFYGNLTRANEDWAFVWEQEYSFKESYGLPDLSPASFVALVDSMAADNSTDPSAPWEVFWRSYTKSYDGPSYTPCEGPCKEGVVGFLNGTGLGGRRDAGEGTLASGKMWRGGLGK